FEKILVYSVVPKAQQQEHIQGLLEEYDNTVKMLNETNEMSSLIAKSNYLRNEKYCPRNPQLKAEVIEFLAHPLLQDHAVYRRVNNRHRSFRIRHHMSKLVKDY